MKKKIIALILVVFSFTLALLFNSCGYSKNSNNQSNLDYYSINYNDDYYFVKGNNVIVKDNDENEKTLFKENESLLLIGIENNTLYYETSNNKTNAFNIKKYELENKKKTVLIDSSSLINYNNELYFIAENTLFKLDKSNNKQKITECENYSTGLEIINDKIYYINLNDKLVYQNLD